MKIKYEPFNKEWEKEVMEMKKADLVELFKHAYQISQRADKMYESLKWFITSMEDGSLIVYTDDYQHKSTRDDNQDQIDKMKSLLKEIES